MSDYDFTPFAALKEYESLHQSEYWPGLDDALKQRCAHTRARYEHWKRRYFRIWEEANNLWQDHYFHAIEEEEYTEKHTRLTHLMQRANRNKDAAFDHFVAALIKACAAVLEPGAA